MGEPIGLASGTSSVGMIASSHVLGIATLEVPGAWPEVDQPPTKTAERIMVIAVRFLANWIVIATPHRTALSLRHKTELVEVNRHSTNTTKSAFAATIQG